MVLVGLLCLFADGILLEGSSSTGLVWVVPPGFIGKHLWDENGTIIGPGSEDILSAHSLGDDRWVVNHSSGDSRFDVFDGRQKIGTFDGRTLFSPSFLPDGRMVAIDYAVVRESLARPGFYPHLLRWVERDFSSGESFFQVDRKVRLERFQFPGAWVVLVNKEVWVIAQSLEKAFRLDDLRALRYQPHLESLREGTHIVLPTGFVNSNPYRLERVVERMEARRLFLDYLSKKTVIHKAWTEGDAYLAYGAFNSPIFWVGRIGTNFVVADSKQFSGYFVESSSRGVWSLDRTTRGLVVYKYPPPE